MRKEPQTGSISLREVRKTYGAQEVLRGISLQVNPGQVVALLGPSGSGKSTLLRTINNLESIDQGSITIDGEHLGYERRRGRLWALPEKRILARRTRVGMVFQHFHLFPHLTAQENIMVAPLALKRYSREEARRQAHHLLLQVGLADHADRFPRQLSGGQQQRVAIARALAMRPHILLFDEPTSALDPELVGEVLAVIRALADGGTTLIVVTHEVAFAAEIADTVVFLESGVIVEQGPAAEVLRAPQHRRTQQFLNRVR